MIQRILCAIAALVLCSCISTSEYQPERRGVWHCAAPGTDEQIIFTGPGLVWHQIDGDVLEVLDVAGRRRFMRADENWDCRMLLPARQ